MTESLWLHSFMHSWYLLTLPFINSAISLILTDIQQLQSYSKYYLETFLEGTFGGHDKPAHSTVTCSVRPTLGFVQRSFELTGRDSTTYLSSWDQCLGTLL